MEFSKVKSTLRKTAVASLAAFIICLTTSAIVVGNDEKSKRRADKALREGEYEVAEKVYRELLAKDSHDHAARLGLSFALLKRRSLQDAYDHAARVVMADPLSPRAHSLLGSVVLAAGDFRNSVEEFRTALTLKENDSLAIAGLAMVDFYENRLDSAIRGLRRAVSLDPYEPDYIFYLGQASARSEKYKDAADAYERFLTIAPKTDADRRGRIRGLIDFLRYLGNQSAIYVLSGEKKTNLTFESLDGRPILKVRINGSKEPLRFVLDTGSGMSVISDVTAKKLGLRPVARGGLARAVGGGGKFEIVYGFVESLELGDVRVGSVPVYIRPFFDAAVPVDGYLGLSVISRFVATVDYGDNSFTMRRGVESAIEHDQATIFKYEATDRTSTALEIPVRTTSSGFLSGEVKLDGVDNPLNFIIDTGASITVVSEKLAEQEDLHTFVQPTRMRVYGAAGVAEDVKSVLLPTLSLGNFSRRNISAAVLDLEPLNETTGFTQSGILGANFLRHFRVSFNFQKGLIRLEPLEKTASTDGRAVISPM